MGLEEDVNQHGLMSWEPGGKAVLGVGQVVSRAAAQLASYDLIGIGKDHIGMVKFASGQEVGYCRISEALNVLIKKSDATFQDRYNVMPLMGSTSICYIY